MEDLIFFTNYLKTCNPSMQFYVSLVNETLHVLYVKMK